MLISNLSELTKLNLQQLPEREKPNGILMCTPEYFKVIDVKNPFMTQSVGKVDEKAAREEWRNLKKTYETVGLKVETITGAPDREDMVFAANFGICWKKSGEKEKHFLASKMKYESRQKEIPHASKWFRERDYTIHELPQDPAMIFEGEGIWHPEKMLLWGGYGQRTTKAAYKYISENFDIPIILLELVTQRLYHIDTAISILDKNTVLFCPKAFTRSGQAMIRHMFPGRIEITMDQATRFMTGNCFSVGDRKVVLQKGDDKVIAELKKSGFTPIGVDLSEFIKSGGNTTCLKLDIYT